MDVSSPYEFPCNRHRLNAVSTRQSIMASDGAATASSRLLALTAPNIGPITCLVGYVRLHSTSSFMCFEHFGREHTARVAR
jgi:hypothetical protein